MNTYIYDNSNDGKTWPEDFEVVAICANTLTEAEQQVNDLHPHGHDLTIKIVVTDFVQGVVYQHYNGIEFAK